MNAGNSLTMKEKQLELPTGIFQTHRRSTLSMRQPTLSKSKSLASMLGEKKRADLGFAAIHEPETQVSEITSLNYVHIKDERILIATDT